MLGGKNKKKSPGYTIVEVLIVLAISGTMFLIAGSFIEGKQQKSSFRAGVNEFASQIQDVIEQVTDGRYTDIPITCNYSGGITTVTAGGSNTQGTNNPCVFFGKVLYFASGTSNYSVLTIGGGRLDTSTVVGITDANPVAISELQTNQTVPQQLTISKVYQNINQPSVSSTGYYNVGIIQTMGSKNNVKNNLSGAQNIKLVAINAPNNGSAYTGYYDGSQFANNHLTTDLQTNIANADICITDGTQYADIGLGIDFSGNNSGQLNASVKMDGTTPC